MTRRYPTEAEAFALMALSSHPTLSSMYPGQIAGLLHPGGNWRQRLAIQAIMYRLSDKQWVQYVMNHGPNPSYSYRCVIDPLHSEIALDGRVRFGKTSAPSQYIVDAVGIPPQLGTVNKLAVSGWRAVMFGDGPHVREVPRYFQSREQAARALLFIFRCRMEAKRAKANARTARRRAANDLRRPGRDRDTVRKVRRQAAGSS